MEKYRPRVNILSDGSGGNATARTSFSHSCIAAANAKPGPVFGRMSDKDWYKAMLAKDETPFQIAVEDIFSQRDAEISVVVSDAVDGYNPLHDLTAAVGAAVAKRLAAAGEKTVHLASPAVPGVAGAIALELELDADAQRGKAEAAAAYLPLAEEVERIKHADPQSAVRETLLDAGFDWPEDFQPGWEQFARQRVAAGGYATPITYLDHVRPIALSLLGQSELTDGQPAFAR